MLSTSRDFSILRGQWWCCCEMQHRNKGRNENMSRSYVHRPKRKVEQVILWVAFKTRSRTVSIFVLIKTFISIETHFLVYQLNIRHWTSSVKVTESPRVWFYSELSSVFVQIISLLLRLILCHPVLPLWKLWVVSCCLYITFLTLLPSVSCAVVEKVSKSLLK